MKTAQKEQLIQITESRRSANLKNIADMNRQQERARELYEQKYSKADWDANNPEAIKYFKKCSVIAAKEIWKF